MQKPPDFDEEFKRIEDEFASFSIEKESNEVEEAIDEESESVDAESASSPTKRESSETEEILDLPNRISDNLKVALFGYRQFEAFGKFLGIEIPAAVNMEEVVSRLAKNIVDPSGEVRLPVDRLIEYLAIMAGQGRIEQGTHWAVDKHTLLLHFPSCLAEFGKWAKERSLPEEVLSKSAYRKQLEEIKDRGGYVEEVDKVRAIDYRKMRVVVIDLKKAEGIGLDVGYFS